MGGTFLSLDQDYQDQFIMQLHDALSGHHSHSVEEAVKYHSSCMTHCRYGEQSVSKCVAITIETRPDYCLKPHLNNMLRYGCTRIEIGVQSVYEVSHSYDSLLQDVARDTNRGHTVTAVCNSFEQAKDCGFKVVTHMMPDLPNMGYERDLLGFKLE